MRGSLPQFAIAVCALSASAAIASATIIDRIAVSVGNRVISTSDIDREIRVTAFLNGTALGTVLNPGAPDVSPTARRAAATRMVEQTLVRLEVENSRYPAPTVADVQPALDQFKKQHYPEDAAYHRALADYGITEQDVLNELIWQRTLLSYIDIRFRPAVQVSDQEIQDYFQKVVKPAAELAHPNQPATLEEYRDQIAETLAGKKEDDEMSRWLAQAKQRNTIVYHDEAFQ
jgi:hypothetical protein